MRWAYYCQQRCVGEEPSIKHHGGFHVGVGEGKEETRTLCATNSVTYTHIYPYLSVFEVRIFLTSGVRILHGHKRIQKGDGFYGKYRTAQRLEVLLLPAIPLVLHIGSAITVYVTIRNYFYLPKEYVLKFVQSHAAALLPLGEHLVPVELRLPLRLP